MVKIRLARGGTIKKPFYRIVAIEKRVKRGGKSLEILGYWNPMTGEKEIKKESVKKWVANGAQITPAVKKLLEK